MEYNECPYVSFETAKRLKDLGFYVYTKTQYTMFGKRLNWGFQQIEDNIDKAHLDFIFAPDLWNAYKWLRDSFGHLKLPSIGVRKCSTKLYFFTLWEVGDTDTYISEQGFQTYDEAWEQGLNKLIDKIIELKKIQEENYD